jgi:hypothetical protein
MKDAIDAAVATLPDPVSVAHVNSIAETILRTAKDGERDPATFATYGAIGASNCAAQLNGEPVKNGCYWGDKPAGHLFRFQGADR